MIIFLATALSTGTAHASGLPFFLNTNVPDYTAKLVVRETYGDGKDNWRVVQHHNGWTHVEETQGDETHIWYGHFFQNVVLSTGKKDGEEIKRFNIRQVEPSYDYLGIKQVKETNDVETVGGEECRWWEIVRKPPAERPIWMTCLTSDGIEVATKVLFSKGKLMSEARLTEIKRGPVPEAEVLPPRQLFEATTWLKPLRPYPDHPPSAVDFEARLVARASDNPSIDKTSEVRLLRHYPWWFRQSDGKDGSIRIDVWNELDNQGISYSSSKRERRIVAGRSSLDPKRPFSEFSSQTGMENLGEQGQFLGENCTWYDLTPNTADASQKQCITSDGIPLKDDHWSGWSAVESFDTVAFTRRPVDIGEMQPPREYLDPSAWGFALQ
ncbi:hypothetical protein ELI13_37320 [Rhizobium ruizarguesonis]|uniref:Uncharacterized protein n=2 Tax=Rhizobium ruizarguesonis TaxID=2081791 RepID=A0ABY1WXE7_9HYPH|nr:hypothetical protein [Rhizobium ruizarguesonis]TAU14430.1 hypothetical protein ELI48_35090 [Rhizobium ruizarguesonis]TAU56967.1 hypothetical protein ELI45_38545 [Rhizobium ruizarguesonis]TAU60972.1 hypothetical protein ELI46_34420 [Rhizobium ruizarguesonis]TAV09016.1 hypothetical protein ELI34_27090 [Rhizobium ruizarguesonis]TAV21054.1 hypothetical protein ELI36_33175 [Rhizobium ruizarguesonis]